VTGALIWRPEAAGFYGILVVDQQGRTAKARVRIRN
jgi:membrane carboxypeptidase/penicillin-binding protein PbpC